MNTFNGGLIMADDRGCVGGFANNCAILFFIILFLLLFWDRGLFGAGIV
jgi:hypothetical protein